MGKFDWKSRLRSLSRGSENFKPTKESAESHLAPAQSPLVETEPVPLSQYPATKIPAHVAFVHIPKTGGTSFHKLLSDMFAPSEIHPERLNKFLEIDPEALKNFRLFSAHMDARSLSVLPDPKYKVTLLREPKERILSLYYFWKSHSWETIELNNLHGPRIAKSLDLLSFLKKRDEAIPINIENAQARAVWGHLFLFGENEPFVADPQKLVHILEAADSFDLIGTLENIEVAVNKLYSDFGIDNVPKIPRLQVGDVTVSGHTNRETIERETITPQISDQLDLLTVYDRPLYEHVVHKSRIKSELDESQ